MAVIHVLDHVERKLAYMAAKLKRIAHLNFVLKINVDIALIKLKQVAADPVTHRKNVLNQRKCKKKLLRGKKL